MKKIAKILLTAVMILQLMPRIVEANWPTSRVDGSQEIMPYMPVNDYYSQQNPPCFTWPLILGATYELIVSSDSEMKDIHYRASNISKNVYGFPYVFVADAEYYWSVRYKTSSGFYSEWRTPSRFYIDADAYEYTVPEIKDIGAMLKQEYPRMLINEEFIEEMRKVLQNNPALSSQFYNIATQWSSNRFPKHSGYRAMGDGTDLILKL